MPASYYEIGSSLQVGCLLWISTLPNTIPLSSFESSGLNLVARSGLRGEICRRHLAYPHDNDQYVPQLAPVILHKHPELCMQGGDEAVDVSS
jgi:hypothetical protein